MPTEKNAWEIEHLKEAVKDLKEVQGKHGEKISDYEKFKAATVEKLLIIFAKLEELQEGDRWIKRIFITALIGAALSGISALIVWAFTN